ncbi:MAG: amino acid adenylation domain-containing protein [Rhodanobacter sp.]|nr:MAG: amino acid adenylation domain-containing protein [Rhodanobacter sp.]
MGRRAAAGGTQRGAGCRVAGRLSCRGSAAPLAGPPGRRAAAAVGPRGVCTSTARAVMTHPMAPASEHELPAAPGVPGMDAEAPTVHAAFARVAAVNPDAQAVAWLGGALTYGELARRAQRVAAGLRRHGVAAGDLVGVLLERSPEALVALLGVLMAGAAYLPLDPRDPPARLRQLLADAGVAFTIGVPGADGVACTALAALDSEDNGLASPVANADALAYVMFTSGSTGTPKGVEITHRGILRLVRGVDYVQLGGQPRVLHAAPLGFDASTFEIWAALLNGGTCVIHAERVPTAHGLGATLASQRVDTAWLTAALFNAVVDEDVRQLTPLRQLLIGGEALSVAHVRRALAALPGTTIINGYGPTECTTFAATYAIPRDLPAEGASIPIGRPIADTTLHIVDAAGAAVPDGTVGELLIGGGGVARGYRHQPALTAERFVLDPQHHERCYRTGDRVRRLPDGALEFVGRLDAQVKINGHRIEPGEVEAALRVVADVRDGAVLVREDRPGRKQLVAYVVGASTLSPPAVRAALAQRLPDFMLPARIVCLERLPVTANGKLDRHALPAPDRQRPALAQPFAAPRNALEAKLCAVFADTLELDAVGRHDHFFELGGSSLLALEAITAIRAAYGDAPSPAAFFDDPTPAGLARALTAVAPAAPRAERHASAEEPIAIIAVAGRFPGAADVEAFWDNLCAGRESITRFATDELDPSIPVATRNDPAYVPARGVLADVDKFDAAFFGVTPREAELTDPQQRVLLELCWACMERAGHVPGADDAEVGVFAGMHNATYFQHQLAAHPELVESFGAFQTMLANEKDYVATRIAHRLDLTGPAISLNTACSTSLVAICEAVEALRSGRCDLALAGGAAITCPPRSGYLAQAGSMLSPDGHTRSFDAQAAGTVFSDGAGVVLLRRWSEALADGDPVIAVIRGGAVNNDGGGKASFMAPSSAGQAAVIAKALARADVPARSIDYVECHGTATPIGDPIELEGLTRAFQAQTPDTGYCRIGSLKSNVGHMVIAAGVASVIKTALALERETLPPSLHYHTPNPAFDLAASPFCVNDRATPWPRRDVPRRAGVSAFGVGGTNAHVVLEEAPLRAASEPAAGPQLLCLSARTSLALRAAAANLAEHLQTHPEANLADVAWTLAIGRKAFARRVAVVAQDGPDAVARLRALAVPEQGDAPASGVVFAFPGQGSTYPGMGRALHAAEPVFRDAFDACMAAAQGSAGFDLRERLWSDDPDALLPTAVMQPAIFAMEYALAQWWRSLGAEPVALVGHSVGEFAAAALAGVFTPEDAMRLVIQRAALMQAQPPGAMLSVRMPADELRAQLPADLTLAVENAPGAGVVAGASEAVAALAASLAARGIACRPLHTSHAFHSALMEPAVAPFHAAAEAVARHVPSLPIVSTVTGQLLDPATVQSADYWANQLRAPVRFSAAAQTVLATPGRVVLEVGPRTVLTAVVRQQPLLRQHGGSAVASLDATVVDETAAVRRAVAVLWCRGCAVDLAALDRRRVRRRLCLPTYPFARERHWVDAVPASTSPPAVAATPFSGDTVMPVAAAADRTASLITRLKSAFEDVAGLDLADADANANFIELGLDSLMLTQLALQVSKTFGAPVSFRELMGDAASFASLAALLDAKLPPDAAPPAVATPVVPAVAAAAAPLAIAAGAPSGYVQQVIAQQMQLMAQQLALLGGAAPMAVPAAPAPAASANPAPVVAPPVVAGDPGAAHVHYDVKQAFGAIARIHTDRDPLTPRQRGLLDRFIARYVARTQQSKTYTQAHRARMADPRVVNGFRPLLKEIIYQVVVERSKGAHLWDLDGNDYVDALNGFGMSLFGWQPDFVLEAIRRQLDLGYEIGPQHPLAGEVADLVCEVTGHERAALCNTGSEAVLGAIRIARTVTGRETIVLFSGSYHGIVDEVIVRGTRKLHAVPAAPGILRNTAEHVIVLDYGTPESLAWIAAHAGELAAVLIEPVQSRRPDFQPVAFLREVRRLTAEQGALCIFDEIVTGFRAHPRGTQGLFGIDADLATYGKVIGGGYPIGVIAGKRQYMDALDGGQWQYGDASIPTVGVTYFAGTFVRHPLALAAAKAVLEHLKREGPALQERLNARTAAFADELNGFCVEVGAPIAIKQSASLWRTQFLEEHPLQDLLFAMMRSRGVHILDHFPCFFTTAHSEADFRLITQAFKASVVELQEAEFLPRKAAVAHTAMDAAHPPVPGARLGREPDGTPCWFVPNPAQPGKYLKVEP